MSAARIDLPNIHILPFRGAFDSTTRTGESTQAPPFLDLNPLVVHIHAFVLDKSKGYYELQQHTKY